MRTVRETYLREMLEGRHLMLTQGRERKIVVYTMGGVSGRKTERERVFVCVRVPLHSACLKKTTFLRSTRGLCPL